MRKIIMYVSIVLLLTAGLLAAGPAAADTIKIGLLAPLTGFASADGFSVNSSVQLAVEHINAQGGLLGKKVELVVYDDRADGKEAVALARKLIEQDRVVAVVGGSYSTPSRAAAPIFQDDQVPFVAAYAVHPDITKAGDYCFRNGFLGLVEGKSAAYTAVELLKAKKIALLTADNDFGRTLAQGFEAYMAKDAKGAKIISSQTYPFSEKDFKAYLTKIKELKPDLIFASGYYFQTGFIVKQAREIGITAKIMGEEGADSPKFLEIAGPAAAEGFVIVTNLDRDDPRPQVQNFLKEYEKRYKTQPDMVGASAYDAFMMICDAIQKAGKTDGPDIRKALAGLKDFNGLTGKLKGFDKDGEVIKEVQVQVVKNGRFRHFGVIKKLDLITP